MPTDTFYSGKIAYSRINLGPNAYVKANDNKFDLPEDPFAYNLGLEKLLKDDKPKDVITHQNPT